MDNQVINKCKSDQELKNKADIFFRAACASHRSQLNEEDFIKEDIRLSKGFLFVVTDDVLKAQYDFVARCVKLLGANLGNEKEVEELAWEQVALSLANNSAPEVSIITKRFLDALSNHTKRSFKYVAPNHLIKFHEQARKIEIGPVEAILSDDLTPNLNYNIESGSEFSIFLGPNGMLIQLPQICWHVSVDVTEGNVREEAAWLINVAISFLRLSYSRSKVDFFPSSGKRSHFFPSFGEVETMPLIKPKVNDQGIIIDILNNNVKTNSSIPRLYVVDDAVAAITKEKEFKDRARVIFNPHKNSLAKRFSQGLGWLTRGRQTVDRAERFLFFFTAIESLLSSNDKTAPVIQTISRYAATILSPDAEDRAIIAKDIRSLYSARSALVHTGEHNVSYSESIAAQRIAETLYKKVMENVSLTISFKEFQRSLSDASYGLPWPKKKRPTAKRHGVKIWPV